MGRTRTIRQRLLAGFVSVAAVAAVLGITGYYAAMVGDGAVTEIGLVRLPSVQSLLVMSEAQTAVDSAENAMLARNLTPAMRTAQYERFAAAKKRADDAWKVYEPLPQTPEEADTWKQFVPAWDAWWKDHEKYVALVKAYEQSPTEDRYAAMSEFALVTIGDSFGKAETLLNKLVEINTVVGAAEAASAKSQASTVKLVSLIAMIGGVAVALALGFGISLSLNRVLTARVSELREGAEQVASASSQVSTAAQALSQGATEQAASLEETSASMEEMSSVTKKNADSASEAAMLMAEVDEQVTRTNGMLDKMVTSMANIVESSSRVSKIVKTIDEIAFQTNILALNAAVEAARAGEAGMGFAVVANEVRNLAQRAAQAARDTTALIEEASNNAQNGQQQVELVNAAIGEFTQSVVRVKTIAQDVSASSQQQSQGISQVSQAVAQMEKVTQTNAATAEESAAASEELNAQAEMTMAVVDRLQAMVSGEGATEAGRARRPVRPRAYAAQPGGPGSRAQTATRRAA